MVSREVKDGYILRFERGEELVKILSDFCDENALYAGVVSGLGGASAATLGYYDLKTKEYVFTTYSNLAELVNLTGNVSLFGGHSFLHLHGVVADQELRTYGGHIKDLIVGGTLELYLRTFPEHIDRVPDADTGLNLLEL